MNEPVGTGATRPLDDTRRRLEAVLDNATVAIFLMDERQHCIYMNRAAEELTGYSFPEVLTLDRPLHDIVHHTYPDGRPFPLDECAIDRAFPEHARMQGEEVFVHKDGSFYPVAFTASPIRDDVSRTIGTIIEVRGTAAEKALEAERARQEERQQLLMNELNHRVKNTLATVQSLAFQTFRNMDQGALERFGGRLETLARAHNILTESAWERASLPAIVDAATEAFGRDRVDTDGPDCEVQPKAAVTLAMVLHELGTNAVKYGALKNADGRVRLSWRCQPQGAKVLLHLSWEEKGGPTVTPPSRRGFGSRLIERQLGLEFGGKVALDYRPDGLVCDMELEVPQDPAIAASQAQPPRI